STNGLEDFAMDPATGYVITFKSDTDADAYKNALNGGDASAITVSESESALRAPATRASEVTHKEFSTVKFENGRSYYRINIYTDGTELKVVRNKFYKITVNSISNLGFHDENLLRPTNPETDPNNASSAWIEAQLSVQPWDEEKQEVDL
ncbi:MAG: fimbria major subunit, partial [Muribaculaceae bacterium]|nr:fimbria major subunit [Muribaculaceae bacterium]